MVRVDEEKKNTLVKLPPRKINLDGFRKSILYEDDNWLIMNKPPHLVVHANSTEQT
ncbi:hypothetical protein KKG31_01180 [Patescibacteria group bacterium]|nr:hypothetical protein [Patescibacteria group bacterium]